MIYAKKVIKERKAKNKNVTITALAKKCGVSAPYLSDVLSGKKPASIKVRRGLSKALGISQAQLFASYQP